jgi:hypothetical protein
MSGLLNKVGKKINEEEEEEDAINEKFSNSADIEHQKIFELAVIKIKIKRLQFTILG